MSAGLGSRERVVLWAGSHAAGGAPDPFPRGSIDDGVLRVYVNSSGAPHPQPEKQRLPQQPTFLAVWRPPEDVHQGSLVEALWERLGPGLGERSIVTHCTAAYEPTGGLPAARAEGDFVGLMVGLTDCVEPAELDAFQRWYDEVHAAEAVAPGIFETARRYRRSGAARSFPAETSPHSLPAPEFLALYESRRPGAEALAELMTPEQRPPSPLHPSCRVRAVWAFDRC